MPANLRIENIGRPRQATPCPSAPTTARVAHAGGRAAAAALLLAAQRGEPELA